MTGVAKPVQNEGHLQSEYRCYSDKCIPVICVSPWYVYPRDMCIPVICVSLWYVYPRDKCIPVICVSPWYMCIPVHISLVICVYRVGIHKTLKLSIPTFKHRATHEQNGGSRGEQDIVLFLVFQHRNQYFVKESTNLQRNLCIPSASVCLTRFTFSC